MGQRCASAFTSVCCQSYIAPHSGAWHGNRVVEGMPARHCRLHHTIVGTCGFSPPRTNIFIFFRCNGGLAMLNTFPTWAAYQCSFPRGPADAPGPGRVGYSDILRKPPQSCLSSIIWTRFTTNTSPMSSRAVQLFLRDRVTCAYSLVLELLKLFFMNDRYILPGTN